MNKQMKAKLFVSRNLIINDKAMELALREILFANDTIIDWEKAEKIFKKNMPELRWSWLVLIFRIVRFNRFLNLILTHKESCVNINVQDMANESQLVYRTMSRLCLVSVYTPMFKQNKRQGRRKAMTFVYTTIFGVRMILGLFPTLVDRMKNNPIRILKPLKLTKRKSWFKGCHDI